MHLVNILERWAAPKAPLNLEKRQTTRTPVINIPLTSDLLPATTSTPAQTTPKDDPTTTPQNTPTQTPSNTQNTQPTTTNRPTTSAQTTSSQPSTTNKPATTNTPSSTNKGTLVTITSTPPASQGTDAPTGVTDTPAITTGTLASAAPKKSNGIDIGDTGGGMSGSSVATAVGVVCGVVGGFAVIIFAIFIWRRHQRRKQMERIGSMEELPRAPSPGPLSRSFTRGGGARQPIDDDDDDFLTPMDTLPNTHRMDEWDSNKSPQHSDTAMYDDKSVYAESVYHEDVGYDQNSNMQDQSQYPQAPPPAMTASNGRFYSGDFSNFGQSAPVGAAVSSPIGTAASPASAGGAIPIYSAMNKYAALSAPGGPGAAVSSPSNTSPVYGATTANQQRPGGGYRAHDSYDAGGYV